MFNCPACHKPLERHRNKIGIFWSCASCSGNAFTLGPLRRILEADTVNGLWQNARSKRADSFRQCPSCRKPMRLCKTQGEHREEELDICVACQMVWFDHAEMEALPSITQEKNLQPVAASSKEADWDFNPIPRGEIPPVPTEQPVNIILAWLGMPIEDDATEFKRKPLVTWGLSTIIVIVSLLAMVDLMKIAQDWAFIPSEMWRHGGLTFITAFFLHGGLMHLLGNTYFLMVFGDNVEDFLGHLKYLALLLVATIVGMFCHVAADPHSMTPCLGASGGISGVIAFYALRFPRARLNFLLTFSWVPLGWVPVAAWLMFFFWLLCQFLLVPFQLDGTINVSVMAHLGGAAVGVIFWVGSLLGDMNVGNKHYKKEGRYRK